MEQLVKEQLKVILTIAMDDYINKLTDMHIDFCLPDDIEAMMSTAAFAVLEGVYGTNKHFRENHMIEDPPEDILPGLNPSHN